MRITGVEIVEFQPSFAGDGYAMSFVRQRVLYDRLVRLTAETGATGIGEIVRWPTYDPAEAAALEDAAVLALRGLHLGDLPPLLDGWRALGKPAMGLAFGVETAMLDLVGRSAGLPVSSLLAGPARGDVPEYLSLSSEAPEAMAEIVGRKGTAFPVIQVKLGTEDIGRDLARVEAVLGVMRQDQLLLADFNGALEPADALAALKGLRDPRLTWEEPCDDYDQNVEVARGLDQPVMFDQCMKDLPTYLRAITDRAAAAVVLKPALIGGLGVARTARDLCAAAGIRMRIDGPWCGQVGAAAALQLALGAPAKLLIASIDLTDPIDTPRDMILKPAPGRVAPVSGPGLGPVPSDLFIAEIGAA